MTLKTIIHVNRQHIAMNNKDDGNRPVYTVRDSRENNVRYAREVLIDGPSHLVYSKDGLRCGARAWIETYAPVVLRDEMTFQEARLAA